MPAKDKPQVTHNIADMSLHEKLVSVGEEVAYLQKDGSAKQYDFLSERKVKEFVGAALRRHGLSLRWEMELLHQERCLVNDKDGHDAIVRATVYITDGKDTVVTQGLGMARNNQDKSVMSAQTAALREALKSEFLIASGDDPENAEGTDDGTVTKRKATKRDMAAESNKFLDAIKRCKSMDELKDLSANVAAAKFTDEFLFPLKEAAAKAKARLNK